MKDEPRKQSGTGLSPKTLLIAAATSAITALVVPMFWEPGTVFAAAMTPVIAALVSEMVRRPVDTVQAVTVKRVAGGAVVIESPEPPSPPEDFDPLAPPSAEELEALPPTTSSRAVHRRRGLTSRQWKIGLATGLLAFVCVAVLLTVSELVAGDPVTSDRGRTTFFGGSKQDDAKPADERDGEEERDAERDAGEEATPTPTPEATSTPAPTATATPAPEATEVPAVPEPQTAPPAASPTPAP